MTTNAPGSDDLRAIQLANDLWDRNVAERNLDGLIDAYSEDGRALPKHRPAVIGKPALAAYWGFLLSLPAFHFDTTDRVIHISEAGDMAWIAGDYDLSFTTEAGPVEDRGSYVLIYEKREGDWELVLDIDNSDVERGGGGGKGQ